MEYGIVYLLTNPYMPGLVKIGMTKQEDLEKRMKELYTTGVPVAFECQFACKVNNKDCAKIERALHTAFEPQRVNKCTLEPTLLCPRLSAQRNRPYCVLK